MAMIKCPECGQEISDKAKKCIHCGKIFVEDTKENICMECGKIIPEDSDLCPYCGCPVEKTASQKVEVTGIKVSKKSKKMFAIIGVVALVVCIIAICGGLYFKKVSEQKKIDEYNTYIDNVNSACDNMLSSAATGETICNLTRSVWYNAIYKKDDSTTNKYTKTPTTKYKGTQYYAFVDDFNEALQNLFKDEDIQKKISSIESSHDSINEMMKKLQNPTDDLKDCHDAIFELNEVYNSLVSLATDPSGNYTSYSSSVNTTINDFKNKYTNIKNKIPEKK